jgi:hypothetical protein
LQLIEVDCDFFWPELKTQAKSLFDFFSNKLIWFFLWLVSPGFFFCVFDKQKTNFGGPKLIIIGLRPPQFVFCWPKTQKNKIQGTSHKKNQISLFEKKIE